MVKSPFAGVCEGDWRRGGVIKVAAHDRRELCFLSPVLADFKEREHHALGFCLDFTLVELMCCFSELLKVRTKKLFFISDSAVVGSAVLWTV